MKFKFRKIDAIIIIALLIIAGFIFFRAGYIPDPSKPKTPNIEFYQDDANNKLIVEYVAGDILWINIQIIGTCDTSDLTKYVLKGDEITNCWSTITIKYGPTGELYGTWTFTEREELPESIISGNERSVSPEDEGPHYTKISVSREWWYYTVVFSKDCDLPDWTVTISFNHMSRYDLFWLKPDILVVTLHSPDGKEYGGIIEKERYLGILRQPTLQATSSNEGFKVTFQDSFAQGKAPNWHVHIEGKNIDNKHDIIMDLQYFAHSAPYWTHSSRLIDKSAGSIASYIFMGCEVTGSVKIDGINYNVKGIGHHEHTWASNIITKGLIKGWDWCHMTLDNGWNIYYSNYYFLPQIQSTKIFEINPFVTVIITTNQGETITKLEDVNIKVTESDQIFLLLNIPSETQITARPSVTQILLQCKSKY
jgi:predicted secreted hydrolase